MTDAPNQPQPVPRASRPWRLWLASGLVLVGCVLAVLFAQRLWHKWEFARRVERGEVQVDKLRGWMTLPYISRVQGVPEAELRQALGAPASGGDDKALRQWFDELGLNEDEGRRRVEALILEHRNDRQPAPPAEAPR